MGNSKSKQLTQFQDKFNEREQSILNDLFNNYLLKINNKPSNFDLDKFSKKLLFGLNVNFMSFLNNYYETKSLERRINENNVFSI